MEAETLDRKSKYHFIVHTNRNIKGVRFNNKVFSKVIRQKAELFHSVDVMVLYKLFNLAYFGIQIDYLSAFNKLVAKYPIHQNWTRIQYLQLLPAPSLDIIQMPNKIKAPPSLIEYLDQSDNYYAPYLSTVAAEEAVKMWHEMIVEYDIYSVTNDKITLALLLAPTLYEWRNAQLLLQATQG